MAAALRDALGDYLRMRRALGYRLVRPEKLLTQFLDHLDATGSEAVTVEAALAWSCSPTGGEVNWWAYRLSVVRGFASYLHTLDPTVEVPATDLLPWRARRAIPYLYSPADIAALLSAAQSLSTPLRRATITTLIGLLAVTGMRVGEAIALDRDDLDVEHGLLVVRHGKFGKSRELVLHSSTVAALQDYLHTRDRLHPAPSSPALLISTAGTRLLYCNVHWTFHRLVQRVGLTPRSAGCRRVLRPPPRPEPIRDRHEVGLKDRFQHHLQRRLDHPVSDRRDTQASELSRPAGLGDHALTHRQRPKRTVLHRRTQIVQEPWDPEALLHVEDGHAVHARSVRAPVPRDPSKRHDQRRRVVHEIEQVIEPAAMISRRPPVQLGLHLRYPPERVHRRSGQRATIRWCLLRHYSLHLHPTAVALPHATGSPGLGVLRRLRPARLTVRLSRSGPLAACSGGSRHQTVPVFTAAHSIEEEPSSAPAASPRLCRRPSP